MLVGVNVGSSSPSYESNYVRVKHQSGLTGEERGRYTESAHQRQERQQHKTSECEHRVTCFCLRL